MKCWIPVFAVAALLISGCAVPLAAPPPTLPPTSTATPAPTATPRQRPTNTPIPATATPELEIARVVEVVDGDTIKVEMNGETYSVRYIGINCPEMDEQGGGDAALMNRQLVEGQHVLLKRDVSETDRSGRLLRYVYLPDGTFVNARLVELGYAEAKNYPPDDAQNSLFTELHHTAVAAGVGLWSLSVAERSQQAPLELPASAPVQIITVDKRAEFVDIHNDSDQAQDLVGWMLLSETGSQACTLSGILEPDQTLRIWSLAADADKDGYNCGFGSTIWNNSDPDPAVLYNAAGQEVSRY